MKNIYRRGLTAIGGIGIFGAGTMIRSYPLIAGLMSIIGYIIICTARDSKREDDKNVMDKT